MSNAAYSSGFLRKYDYRRHKLTLSRALIYALVLFVTTLALALLSRAALPLPRFFGDGMFGTTYICTTLSLSAAVVILAIDPSLLMFDALHNNSWNLYYKLGLRPLSLVLGKLAVIACALLRIYGMALVPSLALGALLGGISGASLVSCIFTALIGVCGMIIIIAPALAVGTLIYNRAISSLVVIASSAILFFLLRTGGYFSYESGTGIPDAVRGLIMPSPLSLSVTALAFVIIFVIGSVALCLSRIKKYDEEELDDNDLMTLGISKEIAIYERSGDRLTVLVSGMALSGEHEALPDMIINEDGSTELLSIDNKGRSRSKKKSARDKK